MTDLKLSTAAGDIAEKLIKDVPAEIKVPVVDLPQADGNSAAKPVEVPKTVEAPVATV